MAIKSKTVKAPEASKLTYKGMYWSQLETVNNMKKTCSI